MQFPECVMPVSAHPFAQLLSPKEVCEAVARSERLSRLRRQVCRPLDKPMIPLRKPADATLAAAAHGD